MKGRRRDRGGAGACSAAARGRAWRMLAALAVALSGTALAQEQRSPGPSGTLLVANKAEASVMLLDLTSGQVVATLATEAGPHEVAVSPDGRWAVVTDYGDGPQPGRTLTVIDVPRGAVARTVDLGAYRRPHGVVWGPDGQYVYVTAETDRVVLEIDARTWRIHHVVPSEQETSHMVAVAPDGRRAYTGNIGGGSVSMLDLRRERMLRITQTGAGTEGVAVSPDGREVWAVNRIAGTVSVLDAGSLAQRANVPCADFPIRVKFTPDGHRVLVNAARSSDLHIFDDASRMELARVVFPLDSTRATPTLLGAQFARSAVPVGLLPMPGSRTAWVALSAMGEVVEVNLTAARVVRRVRVGREPDGLGYSPLRVSPAP